MDANNIKLTKLVYQGEMIVWLSNLDRTKYMLKTYSMQLNLWASMCKSGWTFGSYGNLTAEYPWPLKTDGSGGRGPTIRC